MWVIFFPGISLSWVKSSCPQAPRLSPMSWVLREIARFPLIAPKYSAVSVFAARRKSRKLFYQFALTLSIPHSFSHSLSIALSFSMAFSDEVWKMQTNFLARSTKFSSASTFFLFVVPITFWEGSKYSAKGSSTQQSEQRGGSGGVASCKFVMRKSYKTWVFRVLTKSNWGGNP